MTPIQQKLLSLFDHMTPSQQHQLVEKARQILHPTQCYTGHELMALPEDERKRLVAEAKARKDQEALSTEKVSETTN